MGCKNRLVKVIQNEVIKVDENGNIIEIIPEEEIVNYTYDILGRRIQKQTDQETTKYVYALQQAIQEKKYAPKEVLLGDTNSGTTIILQETRENIYSNNLDDILSVIVTDEINQTSNQYYFEKNHLGSITKITDILGTIVEQYEYALTVGRKSSWGGANTFGVAYASVNNVEAGSKAH